MTDYEIISIQAMVSAKLDSAFYLGSTNPIVIERMELKEKK